MGAEEQLRNKLGHLLAIHYSTTGRDRPSPMITGIVVKEYASSQEWELTFEALKSEEEILKRFATLLSDKENYAIAGWNLRNEALGATPVVYGIEHIRDRMKKAGLGLPAVLGAPPIDVAAVVMSKYGPEYIKNPRLKNIARANRFSTRGFVDGSEEPGLFSQRKYSKLSKSTRCKVLVVEAVIQHLLDNTLILTPASLLAQIEAHPFGLFLQFEASTVIYSYIGSIIYSLWRPMNLSLPLEFIYASTALTSLLLLFDDLFTAIRTRDMGQLAQRSFQILSEGGILFAALISSLALFPHTIVQVDLTSLNFETKLAIGLASLAPVFITVRPLRNVIHVTEGAIRRIWNELT